MPAVSRQVWNWREDNDARRGERLATRLRARGLAAGLVALALGTLVNKVLGHAVIGQVVVGLGAVQALIALWRPLWLAAPQRFLAGAGAVVGHGLGWLLLPPLWLLVFVPVGLWLRLRGRDPLQRRSLATDLTAWIPRRGDPAPDAAERQFLDEDRDARHLARPVGAMPDAVHGDGGPPA